jgi:hypothetical protein
MSVTRFCGFPERGRLQGSGARGRGALIEKVSALVRNQINVAPRSPRPALPQHRRRRREANCLCPPSLVQRLGVYSNRSRGVRYVALLRRFARSLLGKPCESDVHKHSGIHRMDRSYNCDGLGCHSSRDLVPAQACQDRTCLRSCCSQLLVAGSIATKRLLISVAVILLLSGVFEGQSIALMPSSAPPTTPLTVSGTGFPPDAAPTTPLLA